ncbi:RING/U-box superfamily protein [Dorcoceras hygrometricum]|uniref:RING/U-box superfamily protein n=1 Tax=Dorcoceras hygrometricum TaxID=472368 RepID=A0A2Z7AB35_9LAMI|nr:RING/U-box superfamily protein [Dorcoceras hygrometricum]
MCNFTFILFSCIWIPVLRVTQPLLRLFSFLLYPHDPPKNTIFQETASWELDLPVSRFQGSGFCRKNGRETISEHEQMCSICLMEFEKDDLVNELPGCGHVFHVDCMEKWLDRFQFTCPLCRSMVLQNRSSPCKMWDSSY